MIIFNLVLLYEGFFSVALDWISGSPFTLILRVTVATK